MDTLGIIPARSGSKGVRDKNIKMLNGKPLIAYTIENALKCKYITKVMVSTDSQKYESISKSYGAEVPFLRSKENSSDTADSMEVIFEVIEKYKELGIYFENIILLQPTSPLRTISDLNRAFALYNEKEADAVVSVCECEHSPVFCNTLGDDLKMGDFIAKGLPARRQDLEKYYRLNGAIYIANIKKLQERGTFYGENTYAYVMEQSNSIDIDTGLDFQYAEFLLKQYHLKGIDEF